MSLYSKYVQERTNDLVLETDKGFALYRFIDQNTVYIQDIYILPEFRGAKAASELADAIALQAKQRGCSKLLGSVQPSAKNSTISMKVLLGYGMHLLRSHEDAIIFEKDI